MTVTLSYLSRILAALPLPKAIGEKRVFALTEPPVLKPGQSLEFEPSSLSLDVMVEAEWVTDENSHNTFCFWVIVPHKELKIAFDFCGHGVYRLS